MKNVLCLLQSHGALEQKPPWPPKPGEEVTSSGQQPQNLGHQTCTQAAFWEIPATWTRQGESGKMNPPASVVSGEQHSRRLEAF